MLLYVARPKARGPEMVECVYGYDVVADIYMSSWDSKYIHTCHHLCALECAMHNKPIMSMQCIRHVQFALLGATAGCRQMHRSNVSCNGISSKVLHWYAAAKTRIKLKPSVSITPPSPPIPHPRSRKQHFLGKTALSFHSVSSSQLA